MTNTPPEDLTRRVDRVEARLDNLVEIARSLVPNAEIQQQNVAQLTATTERLAAEAALDRQQAAADRQQAAIDRQEFRTEVRRLEAEAAIERQNFNRQMEQQQRSIQQILEYLRDLNGGSSPPN